MVEQVRLCHVLGEAEWREARERGRHAPAGLAAEGFLHCCTPAQLGFVLARHFAGRSALVVLEFDPGKVGARLDWVRSEPDQAPFPHLFGPLPVSAVLEARSVTVPGGTGR